MKKFSLMMTRFAALGSGLVLLQAPTGCTLDEAVVNDLTTLVVQTLVTSLLTGGVPVL